MDSVRRLLARTGSWLRGVIAIFGMAIATTAIAQSQVPANFDLPAQPLEMSLRQIAAAHKLQMIYVRSDLNGIQAPAIRGRFTPGEVIERLTEGTPIAATFSRSDTVVVKPKADEKKPGARGGASTSGPTHLAQATTQTDRAGAGDPTPAKPGEADSVKFEAIVVTAQKRSESIQDVPVSMSAVTSDTLRTFNATRLSDIAAFIPGLQIDSQTGQPGSTNITLRGITTASINSTTTATTIDDVPIGSSSSHGFAALNGTDLLPYDVDHIEVLRGPQGTLYGANSLGGLVKYVTPTPDLTRTTFAAGTDVSAMDHGGSQVGYGLRFVMNVPLVPGSLALNASVGRVYTPGYIDNIGTGERAYNDGKQDAARLSLLWRPSADFRAKVVALYNDSAFDGLGTVLFNVAQGRPVHGYTTTNYLPSGDWRTQKLGIADLSYRLGWATLTSVTGYSDAKGRDDFDISANPFLQARGVLGPGTATYHTKKWSEELRLASEPGPRLQWLLGAFYTDEDTLYTEIDRAIDRATNQPSATLDPLVNSYNPSTFKERAAFANANYKLTDDWDVGAGVRYSENDQDFTSIRSGRIQGPSVITPTTSDNSTTYSLDSRYYFLPEAMVYGRFATGYRPGGTNTLPNVPEVPPAFGPDKVASYEIGLKSEFLGKRLLLNVAAYYIDWTNIQVTDRTVNQFAFVGNAGRAESKGLELLAQYSLPAGFRFGFSGAYTDARMKNDAPAVGAAAGDRLPYSPRFAGSVMADWFGSFGRYKAEAHAVWRYVGSRASNFPRSQSGVAHLAAYDVLDLAAGIGHGPWRAKLFVRNATNTEAFFSAQVFGAAILAPRSIGLGVEYSYR